MPLALSKPIAELRPLDDPSPLSATHPPFNVGSVGPGASWKSQVLSSTLCPMMNSNFGMAEDQGAGHFLRGYQIQTRKIRTIRKVRKIRGESSPLHEFYELNELYEFYVVP